MSPDIVKSLIRKGQTESVFFVECPTAPSEIISYINLIIEAQNGHLLIGVKDCGTVVGLKKSEEKLKQIASQAIQNTPLSFHIVKLVADFKVIVITL
jgi:predicted HTH transcriptional regulator